jgi:predicted membrane channel-forming protein YqfA (hemolysin III family)
MSFEEKSTWASLVVFLVMPTIYFAVILPQLSTTPVADIEYQVPMLVTIGASILAAIGGVILVSVTAPREAGKADQRDKEIGRFGEYVGGTVLGALAIVPLLLTMAEVDYFWIANSLYLAFLVGGVVGAVAKLVAYWRGL